MEITLLGTGSPIPDPNRAGPATLVRAGAATLLVDAGRVPLLAVGRCAIDGHPFGRGGVAEVAELRARTLDGCPPLPGAIADGIRKAAGEK